MVAFAFWVLALWLLNFRFFFWFSLFSTRPYNHIHQQIQIIRYKRHVRMTVVKAIHASRQHESLKVVFVNKSSRKLWQVVVKCAFGSALCWATFRNEQTSRGDMCPVQFIELIEVLGYTTVDQRQKSCK